MKFVDTYEFSMLDFHNYKRGYYAGLADSNGDEPRYREWEEEHRVEYNKIMKEIREGVE